MDNGQLPGRPAGCAMPGRLLLGLIACLLAPCALAQVRTDKASAADESLARARCGSVVIRHCSAEAAAVVRSAATGAAAGPWEATRLADASQSDEVVVTAERVRKAPIRAIFERRLGSADSGRQDAVTTDMGAGVRCTVTRSGSSACSRAADETPGAVGPHFDGSDWSF